MTVKLYILYLTLINTSCAGRSITLRLSKGSDKLVGVLEVKVGRLWGTVCDDHFDETAADVACRQLGYSSALWYSYAGHPSHSISSSSSTIWMDELTCKGNETSLEQCMTKQWGEHNCVHQEDVILQCYPHMHLHVHSMNDENITVGVIQIKYNGHWGGICSTTFDNAAAYVTCVEMGFVTGEVTYTEDHLDNNWLDSISCTGNEPSLIFCEKSSWKSYSCKKSAAVKCYTGNPNVYDVGLTGGRDRFSGLLELKYVNVWGTVCHNSFDNNAATVACREMGFMNGKFITFVGNYSEVKGKNYKIWLDNIKCKGNEAALNECDTSNWGVHSCRHWQDVVVECLNGTQSLTTHHLNLVFAGSVDQYYGQLEMDYAGLRYVFCDKTFDSSAYEVACRHIGMDSGEKIHIDNLQIPDSDRVWPTKVICRGNELDISGCFHETSGCQYSSTVTVLCAYNNKYEMQLTGGMNGQLQVKHNGEWRFVCLKEYGIMGYTDVGYKICMELFGFVLSYKMTYLGPSINKEPGWPYVFNCHHNSHFVGNCPVSDAEKEHCTNYGNYNISCNEEYTYHFALVGGPKPSSGTVMVYRDTSSLLNAKSVEAYIVCNEIYSNSMLGHLACKFYGYEYARYLRSREIDSYTLSRYEATDVVGGHLNCKGNERSFSECDDPNLSFGDCPLSGGIMYSIELECYNQGQYDLRLVGGSDEKMGTVEIFLNGEWGYLCLEDESDYAAAMLACNHMGFSHGVQLHSHQTILCTHLRKIWLDNVRCLGNETEMEQCQHGPWGKPSCVQCNLLNVSCWNNVRLRPVGLNWPNVTAGFLIIEYRGIWGTVCSDMFDDNAAIVTCKEMGFHMGKFYSQSHKCVNTFNSSDTPIWFSRVNCIGTEVSLGNCQVRKWGQNNCSHIDNVFVQCWNDNTDGFTARMVDGDKANSGYLEVFYSGEWGTVCQKAFDVNNFAADVACRDIGYTSGIYVKSRGSFSIASNITTKKIWLDNVQCTGREGSLLQCKRNAWGVHECDHKNDVYIKCFDDDYKLRIKGGIDSRSGRLEIKYRGHWGRVCRRPLHVQDKQTVINVACRQMGFLTGGDIQEKLHGINGEYEGMNYDQYLLTQKNVPIWVEYLTCNGSEPSLSKCIINIGEEKGYCEYKLGMQDLFIRCGNIELRLIGGQNSSVGRVEVKYADKWGTVCDDLFDHNDNAAKVVCFQMGYKSGKYLFKKGHMISHMTDTMSILGPETPIWLDDVVCSGEETNIYDCKHAGWGSHNCDHSEDVFLKCFNS